MDAISMIPFFVIIPLFTAFLLSLIGRLLKRVFVDALSAVSCLLLLVASLYSLNMLRLSAAPALVYKVGGWLPPFGICMVLDGLTSFMLITVNLVAFFVCIYSRNYMEKYTL